MNFKFWLTHGEARDVMPRDPEDTVVTESVDQLAAQSLGSDFERIMFVRRKICYSMAQSSYLEKVLTMLKKYKKELAREIPGGKVPRETLKSDPKLRRYKEDFLRLHLQAEKVLEIVEPHVHRSCFVIQQIGVYSRLTDAFFELGKKVINVLKCMCGESEVRAMRVRVREYERARESVSERLCVGERESVSERLFVGAREDVGECQRRVRVRECESERSCVGECGECEFQRECVRERESMVCVDTNHHFVEKGGKICAALFGYHGGSRLHGLDDVQRGGEGPR